MIAFLRSAPSPLFSRRGLDLDFPMLAGCLALLGLGLVMITSASSEVAAVNADNPMYYMIRHLIYVLLRSFTKLTQDLCGNGFAPSATISQCLPIHFDNVG